MPRIATSWVIVSIVMTVVNREMQPWNSKTCLDKTEWWEGPQSNSSSINSAWKPKVWRKINLTSLLELQRQLELITIMSKGLTKIISRMPRKSVTKSSWTSKTGSLPKMAISTFPISFLSSTRRTRLPQPKLPSKMQHRKAWSSLSVCQVMEQAKERKSSLAEMIQMLTLIWKTCSSTPILAN